jgi:2-phospho-L-lactate guanylyltransferase
MLPTTLVPIRISPFSKSRMAHLMAGRDRALLVRGLLDRVIDVLLDCDLRVVVLAPEGAPEEAEWRPDVETWTDEAVGLNAALGAAVERAGVPVLIVHADLPDITTEDVFAVLDAPGDIVIARARDGGTNALLLRSELRPAFGRLSALRHAQRARAAGLRATVIDRPGLALDVDDGAALTASSSPRPSSSRRPTP